MENIKTALITGGNGLLGKTAAMQLVQHGWSIFLQTSADRDQTESIVDEILETATEADVEVRIAATSADLSIAEDREKLVEQTLNEFGRIDMLINAPCDHPDGEVDLLEMTEESFHDVMECDTASTIFLTQLVANEMVRLAQGGVISNGKIVTVNSVSSYASSPAHSARCIARAALSMATGLFADRLGEYGINTYEIRVGLLNTDKDDEDGENPVDVDMDMEDLTLLKRWGHCDDVGKAIIAIAENYLPYSTGEIINVDGGFHVRRI